MSRMGKTGEDWNGLKLGFLKTVQPNSFSKLICIFVSLESLILSFPCNFLAYFQFHTDVGRVIGKIKQNALDCRNTAPLSEILAIIQLVGFAIRRKVIGIPESWALESEIQL